MPDTGFVKLPTEIWEAVWRIIQGSTLNLPAGQVVEVLEEIRNSVKVVEETKE